MINQTTKKKEGVPYASSQSRNPSRRVRYGEAIREFSLISERVPEVISAKPVNPGQAGIV